MDLNHFNKLLMEFREQELDLLQSKRAEYADDRDVLRNFKEQAEFSNITPLQIGLVLVFKHIQSIKEAVIERKLNWEWETSEGREGTKQRIADARNYLLLLAAIIEEEELKWRNSK